MALKAFFFCQLSKLWHWVAPQKQSFRTILEWKRKHEGQVSPEVRRIIILIFLWNVFPCSKTLAYFIIKSVLRSVFCTVPSTEGQSNNLLFALDSVCLLFTQSHLVYLQNSYVTWLLFPFLWTTANQRTDCSTSRQMWTSKREGFHLTVPWSLPQVPACISLICVATAAWWEQGDIVGNHWRVIFHDTYCSKLW